MIWHRLIDAAKVRLHLVPRRLEAAEWLRHAAPFAAAVLITCIFVAGMQLPSVLSEHRVLVLAGLAALATVVTVGAAWAVGYSWRGIPSLAMLVLGGFGFLLTLASDPARYGLALTVASMAFYALDFMERKEGVRTPDGDERLTVIMLAPATFFAYTFCFAMLEFTSVGVVWMAPLAGVVSAAVVGEIAWRVQRTGAFAWRLPVAALILGAELFTALSFLPLKHLVNGAVLAILLSLLAHKVRDALVPSADQMAFRRHVALSILLVTVILVTAQW